MFITLVITPTTIVISPTTMAITWLAVFLQSVYKPLVTLMAVFGNLVVPLGLHLRNLFNKCTLRAYGDSLSSLFGFFC